MAETLYVLNEGIILPTDFTATPAADTFNLKTSLDDVVTCWITAIAVIVEVINTNKAIQTPKASDKSASKSK